MRDDIDARVGRVFGILRRMADELGERALDRALRDVLQALGAAAHREAEERARILSARAAAASRPIGTGPNGRGYVDDGCYGDVDI